MIHVAARVHQPAAPGDEAAFLAINVEGTRLLLEEALAAGVRDFIFASSVKAVGERERDAVGEARPLSRRRVDPYGVTKLQCER